MSVHKAAAVQCLCVSVLLHGAETWTLLKSEEQKLEALNMSCHLRILGIRWYDFVTNATIINRTGQKSVRDKITRRRHAMFGHVRRLPEVTPAHMALHLAVKARTGHRPPQWRRPRGRPRHPWMQQLEVDTGFAADVAWDTASDRVE